MQEESRSQIQSANSKAHFVKRPSPALRTIGIAFLPTPSTSKATVNDWSSEA